MTIREATAEDVPDLVEMGLRFRAHVYRDTLAENRERLEALALEMVSTPDRVVFVAEEDRTQRLCGMLGIVVFGHPMSGERQATEVFWWVEPEYRGVGIRLLRVGERWAQMRGAVTMQMVAPSESAGVGRLYERLGYREIERAFQRRFEP